MSTTPAIAAPIAALAFPLLDGWADRLIPVAEAAGRAILDARARGFAVARKPDASPVTDADRAAEDIVLAAIAQLAPALPVVAEERMAEGGAPVFDGATFWLIDALDGTREFVKGGDDFTVNIGLVRDGAPVLGIVHAPARGATYVGVVDPAQARPARAEVRRGGETAAVRARPRPARVVVAGSKSHATPALTAPFLAAYDVAETIVIGSSLKFCLVAEGRADLYPRFGPTSEWDTAAGHAVLRAAGGRVHTFDGAELAYGKPDYRNGRFLAEGAPP